MLFSSLLPLLAISCAVAESKPTHGRRSNHVDRDLSAHRRHTLGDAGMVKVRRSKQKQSKKKKKRTCQAVQSAPSNSSYANATSIVTPTTSRIVPVSQSLSASASVGSVTSAIGGNNWANASVVPSSTSSAAVSSSSSVSTSDWTLVQTISGSNFFDAWSFWQWDDPTHGTVTYVDSDTAWNQGLVSINNAGHAIMSVDTTETVTGGRQSVRISNNLVWTGGMVLMDAVHMPTGCGTWPAWWMNGPNWPNGGEIDIIEGVNTFTENQVSLHTGTGCSMPSNIDSGQTGQLTSVSGINTFDCASYDTSNQGCGVRAEGQETSYGSGFNGIGGGVYAMVWDKSGISVWFFARGSIPDDITSDQPDPSTWPTPMAHFPPDNCDPYTFFYDNYNIFDTTLCGDWAGSDGTWNYAGYAGQSQSCAALTGYSTCSDYVLNQGSGFSEAYWEVSYVKYFNSTSQV